MKDAFGGGIMISIVITFLAIYIIFIALTLNYLLAFKIKNGAIDAIEEYEGIKNDSKHATGKYKDPALNKIDGIIDSYKGANEDLTITRVKNGDTDCYYVVTVGVTWEFPLFNIGGTWFIKGETRNVENCGLGISWNGKNYS